MERRIKIGVWTEIESREIRQSASSYAADWEVLKTRPGEYDVLLTLQGGYTIPMPYWILVSINADRIDGRSYSGYAGLNFSSRELPKEPKPLFIQSYAYLLERMVASGTVRLDPEFEDLPKDHIQWAKDNLEMLQAVKASW